MRERFFDRGLARGWIASMKGGGHVALGEGLVDRGLGQRLDKQRRCPCAPLTTPRPVDSAPSRARLRYPISSKFVSIFCLSFCQKNRSVSQIENCASSGSLLRIGESWTDRKCRQNPAPSKCLKNRRRSLRFFDSYILNFKKIINSS